MQNNDLALLREYTRSNSEDAFAALVSRHVNLVYSVAMRTIGYNNAMNPVSFVAGHVSYIKFYFDGKGQPWEYDPPASYDYQWSVK